jgi:flap endonuclease-1
MGLNLGDTIPKKEIEIVELSGKKIAIDAYNNLYQYLTIIRDRISGEPLKDHSGRITSHLSGIFYRTSNLIENGIKPIFVFDGEPPEFKTKTIEARKEAKKEAREKWKEALEKGEEAITYAQRATVLTSEMIEDSKKLLDAMGIPYITAKSEGEAQCAFMCIEKKVDFSASQDFDSLLFGSPYLVRNLSVTGKRKLPKKDMYVDIKPEMINLQQVLSSLEITREQLIIVGLLIGTDYNDGVQKVGPKTALKLVKEHKTLNKVLENVEWKDDIDPEKIYNFFLHPPVIENYNIEFKDPDRDTLIELMVKEHDFSKERVEKIIEKLESSKDRQVNLKNWFGK